MASHFASHFVLRACVPEFAEYAACIGHVQKILLCVLAHSIDEHTVAEYRLVWFVGIQAGAVKSFGHHVVSKIADRRTPAENGASSRVVIRRKQAAYL